MTSEKKISGLSKLLESALGAMKSANKGPKDVVVDLRGAKPQVVHLPVLRPMAEQRLEEYFLALENLVDRFE
jgi:hypothetical protein